MSPGCPSPFTVFIYYRWPKAFVQLLQSLQVLLTQHCPYYTSQIHAAPCQGPLQGPNSKFAQKVFTLSQNKCNLRVNVIIRELNFE